MGIGGAVLYSLAYMAVRGLMNLGTLVGQSLRWAGRAFFDGVTWHGVGLVVGQWFRDPLWSNLHAWRSQRQVEGERNRRLKPPGTPGVIAATGRWTMKRIGLVITLVAIAGGTSLIANGAPAADRGVVDLTQRVPPDLATVGNDPFGQLVKYGYALFTDTANQIGPTVPDQAKRFAGNDLACESCHLRGGTQAYAMPLIGVWGQFPQYRAL